MPKSELIQDYQAEILRMLPGVMRCKDENALSYLYTTMKDKFDKYSKDEATESVCNMNDDDLQEINFHDEEFSDSEFDRDIMQWRMRGILINLIYKEDFDSIMLIYRYAKGITGKRFKKYVDARNTEVGLIKENLHRLLVDTTKPQIYHAYRFLKGLKGE